MCVREALVRIKQPCRRSCCASASRLAMGLAYTRPVPAAAGAAAGAGGGAAAAGAAAGGGGGGGAAAAAGAGAGAAAGAAGAAAAPSSLKFAKAATLPWSGTIMHSSWPTGTSLVPPWMRILARKPSSGVSKPMVALSVSISHSKSPAIRVS